MHNRRIGGVNLIGVISRTAVKAGNHAAGNRIRPAAVGYETVCPDITLIIAGSRLRLNLRVGQLGSVTRFQLDDTFTDINAAAVGRRLVRFIGIHRQNFFNRRPVVFDDNLASGNFSRGISAAVVARLRNLQQFFAGIACSVIVIHNQFAVHFNF